MGIKEILAKLTEKKDLRDRYAMERRIAERYEEKKLSANERELIEYRRQEREKKIKQIVDNIRRKKGDEFYRGKISNLGKVPYVVYDKKDLFKGTSLNKSRIFKK